MVVLHNSFPAYEDYEPLVPVHRLSNGIFPAIHRFYDTSPISPSGRYITFTELPYEDHLPYPGDEATVVVVDLVTGEDIYRSRTIAWDTQLGAQPQWGATDKQLFFNRMSRSDWLPYGVIVDPATGEERRLGGTVYMASPDGRKVASPNLTRIGIAQAGYGVIVPPTHMPRAVGAPIDDGLFVTDVESGDCTLLVSLAELHSQFEKELDVRLSEGALIGFHVKWSPGGDRLMYIIRWRASNTDAPPRNWIITMDADGSNRKIALNDARWLGGHHPNWCPDGDRIVMNLVFPNRRVFSSKVAHLMDKVGRKFKVPLYKPWYSLRLASFRYDGSDLAIIAPSQLGSGHPTWDDGMESVLTDAYPSEPVTQGDGTVPIRLVSAQRDQSTELIRIRTKPVFAGPRQEWRVDPHPAWDPPHGGFVFNARIDDVRGVYYANMREYRAALGASA
ncbi:hypothetical protein GCM10009808_00230 [Microbacterium sediminicola]|uniref:Uncharacterized protein n=1 Tax=Microbacterium sediminicola TaxID=415210 RepID=A0ABN2HFQ5_9MICO